MNDPNVAKVHHAEVYIDSEGMLWGEISYQNHSSLTSLTTPEPNVFIVNASMNAFQIEQVVETML